ncbi:MAG: TRAP transporter small permease subunit [Alphaproteobacteria bacterium]|nr:TRAP transporter small permease subunit [Alphaproteobacteria bacterium]
MQRVNRAAALFGAVEEGLAMLFLVGIAAVINLQVVSRYVMDDPFIWPEEISRILMVWGAWWGVAAVTRRGLHIRFDMMLAHLGAGAVAVLESAVDLASGAFFVFLGYQAYRLIGVTAGLEMAATELPTSILVWPVLFGSALAAVHSALRVITRHAGPPAAAAS